MKNSLEVRTENIQNIPMRSSFVLPLKGKNCPGWTSPAQEELLDTLSFDEWLIEESTFIIKVDTDAMQDAGIHNGDIIILKRGQTPKPGEITIADYNQQWLLRYYVVENNKPSLYPANGNYKPVFPKQLKTIGTVSAVIRKY